MSPTLSAGAPAAFSATYPVDLVLSNSGLPVLYLTGRHDEARTLFEEMLSRCTAAGLLSEDIDPTSGELWGNYPQTYSLVGMINCAGMLSKPWSAIR